MDAQQAFKGMFKALINEDYSIGIDIERYQGVLEHALSKVDFSVGIDILPNLKMFTERHNDEKLAITLLIVGTGLTAYCLTSRYNRWCRGKCASL